jgi:hypothetical protein
MHSQGNTMSSHPSMFTSLQDESVVSKNITNHERGYLSGDMVFL